MKKSDLKVAFTTYKDLHLKAATNFLLKSLHI